MSLLEVKNLKVHYPVKPGRFSRALPHLTNNLTYT
jgi:hypothetical protein